MKAAKPATYPSIRDTRLEAEGAEFLVLGSLLTEGIPAWKAYTRFPGYDILAGDINKRRICRIQVKSRYVTGAPGFPLSNLDCDFVCFVRLNRGSRKYLKLTASRSPIPAGFDDGRRPPEIYVLPIRVVKTARREGPPWGRGGVLLNSITKPDHYLDTWEQITAFLAK